MRAFCLFVGYPRSGHSVVGAVLNAHPDAVIAHEADAAALLLGGATRDELYARLLARAAWFHLRGDRSPETGYSYRVDGQWQGRYRRLELIGDKRGGAVSRALGEHPDLLDRLAALTGTPLRLVHVERDPFDNIAAIAIWHRMSVEDAAAYYFRHRDLVAPLLDREDLVTVRHEELLANPRPVLTDLCRFLGLRPEPDWLAAACAVLFPRPHRSRDRVAWPAATAAEVERRVRA